MRSWILSLILLSPTAILPGQTPPAVPPVTAKLPLYSIVSVKENKSATGGSMIYFLDNGTKATNITMLFLLRNAFDLRKLTDDQITGLPTWTKNTRFDIEAKVDEEDVPKLKDLSSRQRSDMLQAMLADRFGLVAHREVKDGAVYSLVVAKKGPKLIESKYKPGEDNTKGGNSMMNVGQISTERGTMDLLAAMLTQETKRPVVNNTGLTSRYDFKLLWTPEDRADKVAAKAEQTGVEAPPPLFTALNDQLGLRLEPARGPVETLVVDKVEMPAAN